MGRGKILEREEEGEREEGNAILEAEELISDKGERRK
jgi:hypothetical protein